MASSIMIKNPMSDLDRESCLKWSKLAREKNYLQPIQRKHLYEAGRYDDWYVSKLGKVAGALNDLRKHLTGKEQKNINSILKKLDAPNTVVKSNDKSSEQTPKLGEAAESGDPGAQYMLGESYFDGDADEEDDAEAVSWFKKAADQNHAEAQWRLGFCYLFGFGVEDDEAEAVSWYRKAADQDHADAQFQLGHCYYYGSGVEEDDDEAVSWFRKAADQDHSEAQCSMGFCYFNGHGVEEDEAEAVSW
ncbi:sel1 repeat family protein [Rhodospirillales bacterium]|nr:sel1 repeat family protein [Rhodospirillales bacterium]